MVVNSKSLKDKIHKYLLSGLEYQCLHPLAYSSCRKCLLLHELGSDTSHGGFYNENNRERFVGKHNFKWINIVTQENISKCMLLYFFSVANYSASQLFFKQLTHDTSLTTHYL